MSTTEKIVATAPKLMPIVAPTIKAAAPVVLEEAATLAGGALSILSSPVVLGGICLYAAYKITKKIL